jgi:hypothetical protein
VEEALEEERVLAEIVANSKPKVDKNGLDIVAGTSDAEARGRGCRARKQ